MNLMRNAALLLIGVYRRFLSPFLGNHCRFAPSCSAYAQEAFSLHTPGRALRLTAKRLLCCHPFHSGGLDPVPLAEAAALAPLPHG